MMVYDNFKMKISNFINTSKPWDVGSLEDIRRKVGPRVTSAAEDMLFRVCFQMTV